MRSGTRALTRTREGLNISLRALIAGVLACAALALVAAAVLGLIMYRTMLPEAVLPNIMGAVNLVALVVGGYFAGRKAESMGWLNGGLAGLVYTALLVLLGLFFFPGPTAALVVLRRVVVGFVLGALGGTVGVNS
jgi:putative membrane protein (TIGR04086 family)